jgi:hypothetical protein
MHRLGPGSDRLRLQPALHAEADQHRGRQRPTQPGVPVRPHLPVGLRGGYFGDSDADAYIKRPWASPGTPHVLVYDAPTDYTGQTERLTLHVI